LKKILSLSAALLMVVTVIAQSSRKEAALKKYFATVSYGVGSATWYSDIKNSILYDKSGTILKSGNLKFTAKNPSSAWNFQVSFPVRNIRLGMGISFEEFYLDKIILKSGNAGDGNFILFDESFRFDKFYAAVEVPFAPESTKNYSFSATGNLGYYNYTGIERFNFFGEEPLARMYLANVGLLADYKIFKHTYFFINPNFEFKYFQNNRFESPSDINHKILTYSIAAGIRVDVSKE